MNISKECHGHRYSLKLETNVKHFLKYVNIKFGEHFLEKVVMEVIKIVLTDNMGARETPKKFAKDVKHWWWAGP